MTVTPLRRSPPTAVDPSLEAIAEAVQSQPQQRQIRCPAGDILISFRMLTGLEEQARATRFSVHLEGEWVLPTGERCCFVIEEGMAATAYLESAQQCMPLPESTREQILAAIRTTLKL